MLTRKLMISACAAAAMFAALSVSPVNAQQPIDSRTEFTFNNPVELPGVTLPPGTYVFRFVDATTGRKVMQVLAKDSTSKTYGLFLTISAQRPKASDDAELRFMETPSGRPQAIKTWWYPGNTIGREFIYPKSQARRLAQATNQTVLTTQAETVTGDQMKTADLSYVSPSGQETVARDEEIVSAAANTPPTSTSAAANTTAGAGANAGTRAGAAASMDRTPVQEGQSASAATNRTRLPRTYSTLPLIGLIGLTSLLGGAALRFRR